MTLTKAELADLLFEKVGLNKREAKDMVEAFFEEIRNALESGDSVKLSGFGNFQLRDKPQRPGRNPKTGEEIPITARRVVTFHASQKLKAAVESADPMEATSSNPKDDCRRFPPSAISPSAKSASCAASSRTCCATGSRNSPSSSR